MRVLGAHPDTGEEVTVRRGPYGLYVQLGENGEDKKVEAAPHLAAARHGRRADHPGAGAGAAVAAAADRGRIRRRSEEIQAGIGRFGPYVRMGAVYGSLERDDDVLAVGMNRAVDLLAKKLASVRTIGPHPGDKELVSVRKGRFGPYVQHGKTVANLPRGVMMDDVTLDEAVALLAEKGKTAAAARAAGGAACAGCGERSRRLRRRRRHVLARRATPPRPRPQRPCRGKPRPKGPPPAHLPSGEP